MTSIGGDDARLANYVCSSTSLVILSVRLILTRQRDKKFDLASALTATSILVLIVRLVVVYYYLRYGTSQDYLFTTEREKFSSSDLNLIRIGSILALVSRVLITSFYWLQICLLLLFYSAMVRDFHWRNTIKACWLCIVVTYMIVVILTFTECTSAPIHASETRLTKLIRSTISPVLADQSQPGKVCAGLCTAAGAGYLQYHPGSLSASHILAPHCRPTPNVLTEATSRNAVCHRIFLHNHDLPADCLHLC